MASETSSKDVYIDASGVTIHYYRWSPRGEPRAIVQLAHGLGEHAQRYGELVQFLTQSGIEVWADDHRGHGATGLEQWGGDHSKLGKLGPGGMPATLRAVRDFTQGHSWGSIMGQMILNRGGANHYDGMILTGTAYRWPGFMNAGDLNARHKHLGKIGAEWLSRDVAVHEAWRDDPLTFVANTMKLFGPVDAARLIGKPKRLDTDIPLLIMIGSDDSLGGEKSVTKLAEAYVAAGARDVEVQIYDQARHEVFNETNRAEVRADLLIWLEGRLQGANA